jgi:hypothetical protein
MTLLLSGTDGLSDVDGSAATPAIRGTDANTGIFFPAADTIAFSEGGAEIARFDSSGRLLIGGTASPLSSNIRAVLQSPIADGSGGIQLAYNNAGGGGGAIFSNAGSGLTFFGYTGVVGSESYTERMRIDSSGNVGIGTASPAARLQVNVSIGAHRLGTNGSDVNYNVRANAGSNASITFTEDGISDRWTVGCVNGQNYLAFRAGSSNMTNGTEQMRIDSSGRLTTPNQPAFSGQKVNTFVTGGTQTKITLDSIAFNTGSNYSTGTGRFTAPVAGKYVVMMNMRKVGSPEPNGYFGCNTKKNGSDAAIFTYNDASGYGDDSTWAHMVVDCAVNDYFEFYAYPQDSCNITLEVFVYLLG